MREGILLSLCWPFAMLATAGELVTFETGKSPSVEVHVAADGDDVNGDGTIGSPYRSINRATQDATPGTAVRVHPGVYTQRMNVFNLAGTAENPIWIGGVPGEARPIIEGVTEGIHLTQVRYLIIHDLEVRNTSFNGINCDDGGNYSDPDATRHLVFRNLFIHDIGPTGNRDGLKLSGVDDYFVLYCEIARCGGSGIDQVGCHHGLIAHNELRDLTSNAVQCKGGSEDIEIRANRIVSETGSISNRSVNIGGSTGFEFFRPPLSDSQPNFEAKNIRLVANVIEGWGASLAFVGCVDCVARNNTLLNPERYLVRILQETTSTAEIEFLECSNNSVTNNLFYFDDGPLPSSTINIGPNTLPATFSFSSNLWYAHDDPSQSAPNLPVSETNPVIGQDPRFYDADGADYRIRAGSPAFEAGEVLSEPQRDFDGKPYRSSPAIGAFEMTAWQGWRLQHFSDSLELEDPVSGPYATPAGDGIANFVKFAFGLSPHADARGLLPQPQFGSDRLEFTFVRPIGAEFSVRYDAEVSADLENWSSEPESTLSGPPFDLGDGREEVTIADAEGADSAPRRFMRTRVLFVE